ncbi:DUF488 domain-containing protein [Kitasatospora sp. NPDC096147]|uniref:DUF488 domain-containing protein n=1 Tax=Kitasatospora sp. NPDC096147 TaxID=3364093 RepID=UPI00380831E5
MSRHPVQLARVYDPHRPEDGARVLVDRLWPRGIKKEDAALDSWPKALTPSTELRRWYHAGGDFPAFRERYLAELDAPEAADALTGLRTLAATGPVVLLTASKGDLGTSHAAVLRELLAHPGLS